MLFQSLPLLSSLCSRIKHRITYRRELQLAAFFDGELPERKQEKIRAKLDTAKLDMGDSSSGEISRELFGLSEVGEELEVWFSSQVAQENGAERSVDLWSSISEQLESSSASASASAGEFRTNAQLSTAQWREQVASWMGADFFRPPVFVAMGATAAVALMVGAWIGSASTTSPSLDLAFDLALDSAGLIAHSAPGTTSLGGAASSTVLAAAKESGSREQKARVNQDSIPIVSLVGSQAAGSSGFGSEMNSRGSNTRVGSRKLVRREFVVSAPLGLGDSSFRRPLRMHLETSQLIGSAALGKHGARVGGGLRTGRTHIDWIKAKSPVRIVPSRGRNAPPVIWVPQVETDLVETSLPRVGK